MTPHPYAREAYAAALAVPGETAIEIDAWGTAVLSRPIQGGGRDAVGPYPLTVLGDGADLDAGLRALADRGFVSFLGVGDPLGGAVWCDEAFDLARPFKTHHLVHPARYAPSKHHRAEIRRSLARCTVEHAPFADVATEWEALYAQLVERRGVRGAAAFSPAYVRHLARMPELVSFVARVGGEIVAMGLWFAHGGVAYNHLGASSSAGYAVGASYAVYDAAIAHFGDCAVINLGGGAGAADDASDGLARFKRGFADAAVQARLYGKVLDPVRYAALSRGVETTWFPAYRAPTAGAHSDRSASATRSMSAAA